MTDPIAAQAVPPATPPRRRRWRAVLVVALAVTLTAGGFFVLSRPRGPDVALALGFREGATYRYRLTMSTDGTIDTALVDLPLVGEVTETVSYHVVDVAPDGAATIDVGIEDVSGSFSGQPIPASTDMEMRMVIGSDGELREVDGQPVPEALQQGWADPSGAGGLPGMQSFPLLPDGPVGPGDEWVKDVEQPLPFGDGEIRLHSENEFVRYEDVGAVRTAVIESAITSPIDWTIDLAGLAELGRQLDGSDEGFVDVEGLPSSVSYRGRVEQDQTTWLDPDRGEVVRSELSGEFDITTRSEGGQGVGALFGALAVRMAGEMQVTMERLEP
jgi:hypothetical protein